MGASNYEIGLLTTIVLLAQMMQMPGMALTKLLRRRRAIVVVTAVSSRLIWVMIIIAPVLFAQRGFTYVLMWYILACVIGAVGVPPWNSLLRDSVPEEQRGRLLARRLAWGTALALFFTLAGGWFIDWWKVRFPAAQLYGYSLLFLFGLVFGLGSAIAMLRVPEPTLVDQDEGSLFKQMGKPLGDHNFRQLLWFIGVWSFAVNMAAPFFVVYMLEHLKVSLFMVTLCTVTSQLANILFLNLWTRLTERFSNKPVLGVSGFLFVVAILAWIFLPDEGRHWATLPLLFAIHALSGMSVAGVSIASTNIAFKLSPRGEGHVFLTVFGLVAAITGCIAPLIGGTLADFYETRSLSLVTQWASPHADVALQLVNIAQFDFVFIIAFILGLYSLQRLTLVHETGAAPEKVVYDQLMQEMTAPLRTLSSVVTVRRIAFLPLQAVSRTLDKVRSLDETSPADDPRPPAP